MVCIFCLLVISGCKPLSDEISIHKSKHVPFMVILGKHTVYLETSEGLGIRFKEEIPSVFNKKIGFSYHDERDFFLKTIYDQDNPPSLISVNFWHLEPNLQRKCKKRHNDLICKAKFNRPGLTFTTEHPNSSVYPYNHWPKVSDLPCPESYGVVHTSNISCHLVASSKNIFIEVIPSKDDENRFWLHCPKSPGGKYKGERFKWFGCIVYTKVENDIWAYGTLYPLTLESIESVMLPGEHLNLVWKHITTNTQ